MFLNTNRQKQTKMVGVITICGSITLIVSIQFMLLHCLSRERLIKQRNNASTMNIKNCNIRLDKTHQISFRAISFTMMIFLVGVDIPSSMLLIWGSILKLRTYVVPWLCLNAFKMFIIVIFVVVWSIHTMGGFANNNILDFQETHHDENYNIFLSKIDEQ